jgi:hypothetical protein
MARATAALRRLTYILGIFTLTVIVVAGIGVGVLFYKGHALDAESKAFVDGAIPAIAASWNKEELFKRASPELRKTAKPEDLRALFDALSRLGPLVEYQGAAGESRMSFIVGSGSTISALYLAKARFQYGSATFRVVLIKRDGLWMIQNFHVNLPPGTGAPKGA